MAARRNQKTVGDYSLHILIRRVAGVESGARQRDQISTRGNPMAPSRLGSIPTPARGADEPHRALGVSNRLDIHLVDRVGLARGAVCEDERRDSVVAESFRDVIFLVRDREQSMSSAENNEDRQPGDLFLGRQVGRDARVVMPDTRCSPLSDVVISSLAGLPSERAHRPARAGSLPAWPRRQVGRTTAG